MTESELLKTARIWAADAKANPHSFDAWILDNPKGSYDDYVAHRVAEALKPVYAEIQRLRDETHG